MFVLLNKYCSGGLGKKKWDSIKSQLLNSQKNIIVSDDPDKLSDRLSQLIETGERTFVAAGGDGTINYLLTSLLRSLSEDQFAECKIGAIGLGSSKDYFKAYEILKHINNIPILINSDETILRDLGVITSSKHKSNFYWLNNSGIGVIADANYCFNNPNNLLKQLKKISTSLAIYYSSISTIIKNKEYVVDIKSDDFATQSLQITNISIVKNPHISGNLCYPLSFNPTDGFMQVYVCEKMSVIETLRVLLNLTKQKFATSSKTKFWRTKKVQIKSQNNFTVEYDGETFETNEVTFSIINNKVQVCTG